MNKRCIMMKKLIKLANTLDKRGLRKEADYLDALLRKNAQGFPRSFESVRRDLAELSPRHKALQIMTWALGPGQLDSNKYWTGDELAQDLSASKDHWAREGFDKYDTNIEEMAPEIKKLVREIGSTIAGYRNSGDKDYVWEQNPRTDGILDPQWVIRYTSEPPGPDGRHDGPAAIKYIGDAKVQGY